MTSKGQTVNLILISSILTIVLCIKNIRLPINRETKQYVGYPEDSLLNFTELTMKYGYTSEEHTTVTEDGYVLRIFRIVKGKKCKAKTKLPPVILMHGLLLSSDSLLDSGPNAALPYLISDACYDLWVGNVRGNHNSRRHVKWDPDKDEEFWRFSVDEIGSYDVPATIDYVLKQTGEEKLSYIGYSQGAGTFFVMCSERPGYCDKVKVLIALAPSTRHKHTKSALFRFAVRTMYIFEGSLAKLGFHEVFSKGQLSQEFLAFFCQLTSVTEGICTAAQSLLDSFHDDSITNRTRRALFGHFPGGTSLHNMARYGQSMTSDKFVKFDYGADNMRVYGSKTVPVYNLSAVTVPVVTIYGKNDGLVDTKDVKWLNSELPNVVESVLVKDPLWTHFDVVYSRYSKNYVFPKISEYLFLYNYNNIRVQ